MKYHAVFYQLTTSYLKCTYPKQLLLSFIPRDVSKKSLQHFEPYYHTSYLGLRQLEALEQIHKHIQTQM